MINELEPEIREILHKYKPALRYIGVDFCREDVQEALFSTYQGLEAALQSVIEYWYSLQAHQQKLNYPSACLIASLHEGWTPKNWQDDYLQNPLFQSAYLIWWQEAGKVWGESLRNQLIADVGESEQNYEYILFTNGMSLPLTLAQTWGWERVFNYATSLS